MDELRNLFHREMRIYQDFVAYLDCVFNAYYHKCYQEGSAVQDFTGDTIEWILEYNNKQKMRSTKKYSPLLVGIVRHTPQKLFPFKCNHVGINILRWVETYWETSALHRSKVTHALAGYLAKNNVHISHDMIHAVWHFEKFLCASSSDPKLFWRAYALLEPMRLSEHQLILMNNAQETIFPSVQHLLPWMEINITTSRCVDGNNYWLSSLDLQEGYLARAVVHLYYTANDEFYSHVEYMSDTGAASTFQDVVPDDAPENPLTNQFVAAVRGQLPAQG